MSGGQDEAAASTAVGAADAADWGRRLSTAVVLFHEAVGQRVGLNAVDHRALTLIHEHAPLTPGALAALTGLTPGAVTGLVDRLERAGHVARRPDSHDRRRTLLEPAGNGPAGLDEVFADLRAAMSAFMCGYDEHQLATIGHYVQHTIEVLQDQTRRLSGRRR